MKRTGEILRDAREAKGLSLNEIALSLKINSKVLSAIEEGDNARLPGKAFLRGFVQSYANYLRVNVEEVMRIYTEEMGPTKPTQLDSPITLRSPETTGVQTPSAEATPELAASEPVVIPTPPRPSGRQKSDASIVQMEERSHTRALFISVGVGAIIVMIFATKKVIDRYQRESVPAEVSVSSPLPNPETGTGTATTTPSGTSIATTASSSASSGADAKPSTPTAGKESLATIASTAASTSATKNEKPAPAKSPEVKPETKAADAAKTEAPKVVPEKSAEAKKEEPKKDETKKEETKTAEAEAPKKSRKGKPLELIIEALDTVEIEYSTANGPAQKVTLQPETVHTIRSTNGIKVNISNGGAASLTLNGKDLGAAGDLGQAVKLNY